MGFDPWQDINDNDYKPLNISGALPVHNDAEMLKYSLPALTCTRLTELVFVLDRCTDNSAKIIDAWIRKHHPNYLVRVVTKTEQSWSSAIAEAFQRAFECCRGDVIYSLAADCVYDPKIFHYDNRYDAMCFDFLDWDPNVSLVRQSYDEVLRKIRRYKRVGNVFAIKKHVWQKIGGFQDHDQDSMWHPHGTWLFEELTKKGFKYIMKPSNTIHLRADVLNKKSQLNQGALRHRLGYPFWRVLVHSFVHVKPYVVRGYLLDSS